MAVYSIVDPQMGRCPLFYTSGSKAKPMPAMRGLEQVWMTGYILLIIVGSM